MNFPEIRSLRVPASPGTTAAPAAVDTGLSSDRVPAAPDGAGCLAASGSRPSPAIAYSEAGPPDGPTVIFLHGIGGNKSNWRGQQQYLASHGYRAIAWDARGYGASDDYDGPFDFADISADLCRLMAHAGVETAHFVGLSMGGRMLMDFADRHPGRLRSLTLCGAFPSFNKALTPQQRDDFLRLRQAPLLQGKTFAELAPELIRSLTSPYASSTVQGLLYDSICALRKEPYLKALAAASEFDRTREIQRITVPTLLLYAEDDRLTPPEMGREVAAMMPHAEFTLLPRCGHLMNLECPEAFNTRLLAFLQTQG